MKKCVCPIAALFGFAIVGCATSQTKTIVYDSFQNGTGYRQEGEEYTLADYQKKWVTPFGLGEMAINDTRSFSNGEFTLHAAPFRTSKDFSVFDHIKYFALNPAPVAIPRSGSIMFSADIEAETPGTVPGRVIEGVYTSSGQPYRAIVLEGQQACATLHMMDFQTGQLFDWLVSGSRALALTERLASEITGSSDYVGPEMMYTQIVGEFDISPGKHNYAIRYKRNSVGDSVEFLIDHKVVVSYRDVGLPLDNRVEFIKFPALGTGELLKDRMRQFSMAHGVFSLLDAFPFQHPDAKEHAVSIPIENRIYGQGVIATFDNFEIDIHTSTPTR